MGGLALQGCDTYYDSFRRGIRLTSNYCFAVRRNSAVSVQIKSSNNLFAYMSADRSSGALRGVTFHEISLSNNWLPFMLHYKCTDLLQYGVICDRIPTLLFFSLFCIHSFFSLLHHFSLPPRTHSYHLVPWLFGPLYCTSHPCTFITICLMAGLRASHEWLR